MIGIGAGAKNFNQSIFMESLNEEYKLFDTASIYPGTNIIGNCIKHIENERKLNIRDCGKIWCGYKDLKFISKLWINELGNNRKNDCESRNNDIENNCRKIISNLNLTYLDILLIHWPLKVNKDTNITEEFIIEEIWPQMEELVYKGLVKEIGISNFGLIELHKLLNKCRIRPTYNQIEVNPYNSNNLIIDFCKKCNIKVFGHSPFNFGWINGNIELFSENTLLILSKKYNVPISCIILNWIISKGVIPIVGTSSIAHLKEYKFYKNFVLLNSEKNIIEKLNKNKKLYDANYNLHNCSYYPKFSFNNFEVLVGTHLNLTLNSIYLNDNNFVEKCKISLTEGPGYLIIKGLFKQYIDVIRNNIPPPPNDLNKWTRWNGHGGFKNNLINSHKIYSEIIDNNLIGLIVESLLGWDCKLDNCAFSISRTGELSNFFGFHQDSPFEQNPGAKLPPHNYPLVLQCICAVDDFTKDNGCLHVVPYSHKNRLRIHLPEEGNIRKGILPNNSQPVYMSSGDVCIAIGNIWHGAEANKTDKDRRAFLIEYVSSIIEPRDRLNENIINNNIWQLFSARMIRLLYGGRERYFSEPTLENAWKEYLKKNDFTNKLNIY